MLRTDRQTDREQAENSFTVWVKVCLQIHADHKFDITRATITMAALYYTAIEIRKNA